MLYRRGETAVIVPIAEAEPLVAPSRLRHDPSAPHGVPAHVTLLYPYLPEPHVTPDVLAQLGGIVAARPAFEVTFARFGRFPDTLYLAPDPAFPFVQLTGAIWARWPEAPPNRGQFDEVVPHLTLAHRADPETFAGVERVVAAGLPFVARVRDAWLYAFDGTAWHARTRLPLGPADLS